MDVLGPEREFISNAHLFHNYLDFIFLFIRDELQPHWSSVECHDVKSFHCNRSISMSKEYHLSNATAGAVLSEKDFRFLDGTDCAEKIFQVLCSHTITQIIDDNSVLILVDGDLFCSMILPASTNLLECVYDWNSSMQRRQQTDIIHFDFQKAFDSVSHQKLLNIVKSYDITGNLFQWLSNFLYHRKEHVLINETISVRLMLLVVCLVPNLH